MGIVGRGCVLDGTTVVKTKDGVGDGEGDGEGDGLRDDEAAAPWF